MIVLVLQDAVTEAVQVIGGKVTVVQGDTAVLPCLLMDSTESLTQITWQRRTRSVKQNTNFYTILFENGPQFFNGLDKRFSFVGNFSVKNGSLQLSNVTLSDEGTYTCIYTLFPSGNYKTEIPLTVLVPPKANMEDKFLFLGNDEVDLGTCVAASSQPPAKVDWLLGNLSDMLKITLNSSKNADGTTTTVSTLSGAPTRHLYNRLVQCVITSPASPGGTTLPLSIQIHFPPDEVSINESSKSSFECMSEANPKANITWSRLDQPWPESAVKVNGAVLQILKPTPQLNGLYECKFTNTYGTSRGRLYLHLSSDGTCTPCWIMFCLLLFAIAVFAAMWYYRSDKKCPSPCFFSREEDRSTHRTLEGREQERAQELPLRGARESESELD